MLAAQLKSPRKRSFCWRRPAPAASRWAFIPRPPAGGFPVGAGARTPRGGGSPQQRRSACPASPLPLCRAPLRGVALRRSGARSACAFSGSPPRLAGVGASPCGVAPAAFVGSPSRQAVAVARLAGGGPLLLSRVGPPAGALRVARCGGLPVKAARAPAERGFCSAHGAGGYAAQGAAVGAVAPVPKGNPLPCRTLCPCPRSGLTSLGKVLLIRTQTASDSEATHHFERSAV